MNNDVILLIDDEVVLANNYRLILENAGFKVHVEHSAEAALDFCSNHHPGFVLCDIMMENMDGLSFYKEFKNMGFVDVPFIFLTAMTDFNYIRKGMILGADDYITKPVSGKDLIESITSRLNRKKQLNKTLEKKLNSTHSKLNKKIDNLNKLAFNESHLIRGPLTSIMAIVDLIDTSSLDDTSKELFEKIEPLCHKIDEVIHKNISYFES